MVEGEYLIQTLILFVRESFTAGSGSKINVAMILKLCGLELLNSFGTSIIAPVIGHDTTVNSSFHSRGLVIVSPSLSSISYPPFTSKEFEKLLHPMRT